MALGRDLVEDDAVVDRVHDHTDVGVVLRRSTHHRRAADVDELDARVRGERVQVDDDEVDGVDAVFGHVGLVGRVRRIGEQPAVHLRVQRDDAVIEDGRQPGEVGEIGDRHAGLGDGFGGPAAADDPPPGCMQPCGELDDAGLVVHGEERGGHAPNVGGAVDGARGRFTRCEAPTVQNATPRGRVDAGGVRSLAP